MREREINYQHKLCVVMDGSTSSVRSPVPCLHPHTPKTDELHAHPPAATHKDKMSLLIDVASLLSHNMSQVRKRQSYVAMCCVAYLLITNGCVTAYSDCRSYWPGWSGGQQNLRIKSLINVPEMRWFKPQCLVHQIVFVSHWFQPQCHHIIVKLRFPTLLEG